MKTLKPIFSRWPPPHMQHSKTHHIQNFGAETLLLLLMMIAFITIFSALEQTRDLSIKITSRTCRFRHADISDFAKFYVKTHFVRTVTGANWKFIINAVVINDSAKPIAQSSGRQYAWLKSTAFYTVTLQRPTVSNLTRRKGQRYDKTRSITTV